MKTQDLQKSWTYQTTFNGLRQDMKNRLSCVSESTMKNQKGEEG